MRLQRGGGLVEDELLYLHFQKREYATPQDVIDSGRFWLSNNGCLPMEGPIHAADVDLYNRFSPLREVEAAARKEQFIWSRRFKKYVLHR